jgi:hypothetical protein
VPVLIPVEPICILLETIGEVIQTESIINTFIGHICLGNEWIRGIIVFLLSPVNRDLRF